MYIIKSDDILLELAMSKSDPATVEYETRAKNLLKGELKRRGITYAGLAEKLAMVGVTENERNLNNKISRGGFTAAFLLQCLTAIEAKEIRI
ncbi:MAG: DUF6471 domain-containing protein [Pseudomonadota bacterium]